MRIGYAIDLHARAAVTDEVRCHASSDGTHASRMDAIAGLADLVTATHAAGEPS